VSEWPPISEPELLDRLAMDDRRFEELIRGVVAAVPCRDFDSAVFEQALGYPWERPPGSYRLSGEDVELLGEMAAEEREHALGDFPADGGGRVPVLAFGSNAAPAALGRKFAHLPAKEDRAVLALTGRLHDFDVGASPHPAFYGSLPATLFPSSGTEVRATVLWVTPAQFTQLAWSELSYRPGRLRTRFVCDEGEFGFDEILAFVSRFGSFCVDESPVALAAIPADGRTAEALTQEQLLDIVAALAIGPGADAEALVRAIFERMEETSLKIAATAREAARPFASERWTPFDPARSGGRPT
jgi:hypothetical protein